MVGDGRRRAWIPKGHANMRTGGTPVEAPRRKQNSSGSARQANHHVALLGAKTALRRGVRLSWVEARKGGLLQVIGNVSCPDSTPLLSTPPPAPGLGQGWA
jgi:hypothetical protein